MSHHSYGKSILGEGGTANEGRGKSTGVSQESSGSSGAWDGAFSRLRLRR